MHNCIFTPYCTELFCDKSCPILAETSYLLERNNINIRSFVFSDTSIDYASSQSLLDRITNTTGVYVVGPSSKRTTSQYADIFTYTAICNNWQGSRLHCTVYNLKYSKYLDDLKQSWSAKSEPESLEYTRIWAESAKVLIISNIDYVNFGDFESQTLLNLLQVRDDGEHTTLIVSPPLTNLVSSKASRFFTMLKTRLIEAAKVVKS